MYASYAQRTHAASPNRPVTWLLEGDFVQYTYDDQTSKLSWNEMRTLAGDIVCAIKANAPNVLVAMNHSAWLASQQADSWSNQTAGTLAQRASEGVIAVNVTSPPTDYQSRIGNLGSIGTCN
jgi:hypothetical protein